MPQTPKNLSTAFAGIRFFLIGGGVLLIALFSLGIGSIPISPSSFFKIITGNPQGDPLLWTIVVDFRLPRVLTATLTGAALATAGLMMQTVFRNPLADPFVLGVNAGASLGVALVLLLVTPAGIGLAESLAASGKFAIIFASSGGAAATLFAVLVLSRKVDVMSVLIIGLMISYAVGAIVSILMFFTMPERLQSFLNWSFGDYGNVSWDVMPAFGPAIIIGLVLSFCLVKPLDALLLGEHYAESVGTRTKTARFLILLAASLLAGTVTGFCGPIGFLGIAAPHLARYIFRTSRHRTLIPASILTGAFLSLGSDFLARGPGLETALPLNAITALVGAPVIIIALIRQRSMQRTF